MMKFWQKLVKIASKNVVMKNDMRHFKPSLIYSQEDLHPSDFLIDLISSAIKIAWERKLVCGKDNLPDSDLLNIYPGEHYRLLSAVVKLMQPSHVVEIGTWTGLGTLALASGLESVRVSTFDVVDWDKITVPSHFVKTDFESKNINQIIGNWEVEPIRYLAVNAGFKATVAADYEEKITGRPSLIASLVDPLINR